MFKIRKNEDIENLIVQDRRREKKSKEKVNVKWIITIICIAFSLSLLLSLVADLLIPNVSLIIGLLITLLFILLGILFDIVGVAVTSSNESVFHSMNSRKVRGANIAVLFKKNAEKVSSFCCDVIGDICGILSGSAASTIALLLISKYSLAALPTTIIIAAVVASLTIGGKAIGKTFAINKSDIILYEFSKFVSYFYKKK